MLVAAVLDAEGSPKFIASLIAALVKSRAKSGTINWRDVMSNKFPTFKQFYKIKILYKRDDKNENMIRHRFVTVHIALIDRGNFHKRIFEIWLLFVWNFYWLMKDER